MQHGNLPSAPNYTNPALFMAAVNLFWILVILWVTFGLPTVLVIGYILDKLITRIGRRSQEQLGSKP